MKDLLIAEAGVVIQATILVTVFYWVMHFIIGVPFSWFWFGTGIGLLTVATNAVFFYARSRNPFWIQVAERFN